MSSDLSTLLTLPAVGGVLPSLILSLSVAVFTWAALTDLRTLTIPNKLPALLLGLYGLFVLTLPEATALAVHVPTALLCAGVVLCAGIALFAFGWLGGGDGKLLAVAALWVGLDGLGLMLILTALMGGALALLQVSVFAPVAAMAFEKVGRRDAAQVVSGRHVPYGIAISGATLVALSLQVWG